MCAANPEPLRIPVVLGSVRVNRRSFHPARLLNARVAANGHHTQQIDLRDLNLPTYDGNPSNDEHSSVQLLREIIAGADALIWLTPEYNHSFTSATKNAIDYLGRELWRKPVAVVGLSSGMLGGARAVEQLNLVLIELRAVPIRESVYFSDACALFNAEGQLLRPDFVRRIDAMLAELTWYGYVLKWGRANLTEEH